MTRRDWILAVALAAAAALFTTGAWFTWDAGIALMLAAPLVAGWVWLLFTGDTEPPAVEDIE